MAQLGRDRDEGKGIKQWSYGSSEQPDKQLPTSTRQLSVSMCGYSYFNVTGNLPPREACSGPLNCSSNHLTI